MDYQKLKSSISAAMKMDVSPMLKSMISYLITLLKRAAPYLITLLKRAVPYLIAMIETFALINVMITSGRHNGAFLNAIVYFPMAAILILLPIHWYTVYTLNSLLIFLTVYINDCLIYVRGRPLHYIDFYCIKEAARVSGGYNLLLDDKTLSLFVLTVEITFLSCAFYFLYQKRRTDKMKRRWKSLTGLFIFGCSLMAWGKLSGINPKLDFREDSFVNYNGVFLSLYIEHDNMKLEEPEGYSQGVSETLLSRYTDQGTDCSDTVPDNIFVIMNESLADFSQIGKLQIQDYLPNLHSLQDNCVYGRCAVDTYGGNTCNSEYEFLTGQSLAFMPQGTIPYLTYTPNGQPTIAKEMDSLSYVPIAIHPYIGEEWKRTVIYPKYGFSEFISGEKFSERYEGGKADNIFDDVVNSNHQQFGDDLDYLRGFVSDAECYRKISASAQEEKNFIFAVTVQNHGGFGEKHTDMPGYTQFIEEGQPNTVENNEYLNAARCSDSAFADFLETLRGSDRKTVVLMFGDHQPNMRFSDGMFERMYDENGNDAQQESSRFIVPFVFWANYDIDWDVPDFISLNYLSAVLKKNCGLPLSQFDQFRLDAMKEYPVFTSVFAVNQNGEYLEPETALQSDVLKEYAVVQYDRSPK